MYENISMSEPVQYPKLSCTANQEKKIMECDVEQISMGSWKGIPYSYQFLYRIKASEDSCNSSERFGLLELLISFCQIF